MPDSFGTVRTVLDGEHDEVSVEGGGEILENLLELGKGFLKELGSTTDRAQLTEGVFLAEASTGEPNFLHGVVITKG